MKKVAVFLPKMHQNTFGSRAICAPQTSYSRSGAYTSKGKEVRGWMGEEGRGLLPRGGKEERE